MFRDLIRSPRHAGVAFFMIPLLLGGCRGDGERAIGPSYGDPSELIAWVSVTPATFRAGETVQIEVGIRNPTTRPIVMGFTSGSCALSYGVKGRSDVYVAPAFACTADAPTCELAPGEVIAMTHLWDGTGPQGALSPGEYRVQPGGFIFPATKPVTIEILAP